MKLPLATIASARRRHVHDQIAALIQEALSLGITPTQLDNMTALAWMRTRDGRAA